MSTEFGAAVTLRRPEPPSPILFLLVSLLVSSAVTAASGWFLHQRSCARIERLAVIGALERRVALSDALRAVSIAQSVEPARSNGRVAARVLADRSLAALDAAPDGSAEWHQRISALRELVRSRLQLDDGEPARRLTGAIAAAGAELQHSELARAARLNTAAEARQLSMNLMLRLIALIAMTAVLLAMWLGWRSRQRHFQLGCEAVALANRLQAVFAGTSDAVLILGRDLLVEDANPAAERLLDRPAEALRGCLLADIVDPAEGGSADPARCAGHELSADRTARRADGSAVPVDIAFGAMPAAAGGRFVASLRDASERRAAERMKDDFISTISHELRTPLTSVVGALGLLREGAAGNLPDAAARLIDIAESNSRRLIRLVNDILDIDRLGSGRMTLDVAPLEVGEIAGRAVPAAEGLAAPRGVRLRLEPPVAPVPVLGDADRLIQVIGNLLSNAIRFSPASGEVIVTVEARGSEATVRVEDRGPGVPREFRERLFGRFTQSSAGAAIPGGTGLGLAISREIIRAHGGDIWYSDRKGGGAQFCFTLPLAAVAAPDTRRRLLLCEDDAGIASLMREMIEDEGYLVDRCGSAAEALAMARTGRYDVLLLDLGLPDADGLDAVRTVRAQPETCDLPVIVVSGSAEHRQKDPAAAGLDVAAWLNKPVNHRRLLKALDAAIVDADRARPVLLHVEDDSDVRAVVALTLADRGRMLQAGSLASARAALAACRPAAAILDIDLPDGSGLDLLPDLADAADGRIPAIIYSAGSAIPAVGGGVDAVLVKSARSLLALSDTVAAVLERTQEGDDR